MVPAPGGPSLGHQARRLAAAMGMPLLLAGCGGPGGAPGEAPIAVPTTAVPPPTAPTSAARADFQGAVDIGGGRKMYLECRGQGTRTVVLISGQRGSAADWSITESRSDPPSPAVFEALAREARVCAYDRPGTPVGDQFSRSDPAPQPTTAGAGAADLAALLQAAGETGPYVLVAHSAGGMIARLFASSHPDDVAGLVLVDALAEGLQDHETPAQWEIQRGLLQGNIADSLAEYPDLERFDADTSFRQLRAAPPLRPMPLVVLSADAPMGPLFKEMAAAGTLPAGVPDGFADVLETAQRASQAQLAQLVPGAKHVTETHSGHNIHHEQPQLVVEAAREVIAASR
jgi:pimeloyl-ACP methyl ester carboxylesterase